MVRLLRPGLRGAFLGVLCSLVCWGVCRTDDLLRLDEWMFDGCVARRGARPSQARVVLVGLDTPFLDEVGKPLAYTSPELAAVVEYLNRQGASAVGLDLIVPEGLRDWEGLGAGGKGDAEILGRAIEKAGNVVLAKQFLGRQAPGEGTVGKWLFPLPQWQLKNATRPATTDFGFINLTEDDDRFVRRQRLCAGTEETPHLHFALALYAVARRLQVRCGSDGLFLDGARIPLDSEGKLRINFAGPPGTFPYVRFGDVLAWARKNDRAPPVDFHDAVVIIGVTGGESPDYHPTPFANKFFARLFSSEAGLMSGPEIHANVIATLSDRAFVHVPPRLETLALLLLVGAALGLALQRLNLEWGAVLTVGHHFAWKALAVVAFASLGWRLELLPMLLLGALVYAATFALRWRRLRRMMGVVKSEAITRALESGAVDLSARGELRVVTVLFCDVRSFTDYSSAHSAPEVVKLLNTYFGAIVPLVEAHGGTLNQYMGDGIMVLFNAPAPQKDHSLRALEAAVALVQRVHEMGDTWAKLDNAGFRIGVGIHRGEAVLGALGSPHRLDYTAIGDTVNVASRLESENKTLKSEILISSDTYRAIPAEARRRLGVADDAVPVQVKGVPRPIPVHRVDVPARSPGNVPGKRAEAP